MSHTKTPIGIPSMFFKKCIKFCYYFAVSIAFIFCQNYTQVAFGEDTLSLKPTQNQVLTCAEVRDRMNQMLDLHYLFKDFNEELSQRTFHKLFTALDPSKIFFTLQDLNHFKELKTTLGEKIQNNDCSFVFDIYDVFKQRVKSRVEKAHKILRHSLIFNPPKLMEVGKANWLYTQSELDERLTKKILFQYLSMKNDDNYSEAIKEIIDKNYNKIEKKYLNYSTDKLYSILLNSFAESLDPHSSHMLPSEQDSFNIHITNKLEGIGALLKEEDGAILVKSLIKGGVAQKDGRLKVNDRLIAVDAGDGVGYRDLSSLDLDEAVNLIRGKKGSQIKLIIIRKGLEETEKININLVRDEVDIQNENVHSIVYNYKGNSVGIIKIPNFYTDLNCKNKLFVRCEGVAYDTEQELRKLVKMGVSAVLIDLRNNGGGDFPESIKLASLFIPHGTIVQTMDKNKFKTKQDSFDYAWIYKGPLVVLINRFSASASEIFAGAIQDYERGIIVGDDHSYGKATVQVVQEISGTNGRKSDGAIKVTQNKFYRPGGSSNQRIGVRSDIFVPSINVAYDIGEGYLEYALPRDTTSSATGFKPFQDLSPLISKLKKMSAERLADNSNYKEIFAKIEKIRNEKNKPLPLTMKYIKVIEARKNADDQINEELDNNSDNFAVLDKKDEQLKEAVEITIDTVKLSANTPKWVGVR
jgi:carboxyl-terminal processing protease